VTENSDINIYLSMNDKQDKCQTIIFLFQNKMQQEEVFPVIVSFFCIIKIMKQIYSKQIKSLGVLKALIYKPQNRSFIMKEGKTKKYPDYFCAPQLFCKNQK
jgi:hypothetical protein